MIELRDYQVKAKNDAREALKRHRRACLVSPTRSGKTPIFVSIAQSAREKGKRITITAHRRRIVREISRTLDNFGLKHGLIVPGHRMTDDAVQVGMIQTLGKRLDKVREPDLWIIDECHHSVAGSYKKIADRWKKARHLGVTATPARLDGKPLRDAFDTLVLGPTSPELRAQGWLAAFDYYAPPPKADLDSLSTKMGDYSLDEMALAMDKAVVYGDVLGHWEQIARGTRTLVSCCNVDHCRKVAAAFNERGYRFAPIYGALGDADCERLINALETGKLDGLTFCDLLDEGVTVEGIRTVVMLRRMKSLSKYLQIIGRVMGRSEHTAIILDHVGNAEIHGYPDDPRVWSLEGKAKSESPGTRTCKECFRVFSAAEAKPCGAAECGLIPVVGEGGGALPETVEGELIRVVDPWQWARGIDPVLARGEEWKALLAHAGDDRKRLDQIRRARGYKWQWTTHILKARHAEASLRQAGIL